MQRRHPVLAAIIPIVITCGVFAFPSEACSSGADERLKAANPEMARLAAALGGDWDTIETMEHSSFFPQGGSRHGVVHARLASGGYTLIYEVHSDGTAGQLDGFHVIWWDQKANLYRFYACFNEPENPCIDRGTAHWEGGALVNDYQFEVEGKNKPGRDTFTFTARAHTLVATIQPDGHKEMTTLVTTRATRRRSGAQRFRQADKQP
jgi:hypothetical protein